MANQLFLPSLALIQYSDIAGERMFKHTKNAALVNSLVLVAQYSIQTAQDVGLYKLSETTQVSRHSKADMGLTIGPFDNPIHRYKKIIPGGNLFLNDVALTEATPESICLPIPENSSNSLITLASKLKIQSLLVNLLYSSFKDVEIDSDGNIKYHSRVSDESTYHTAQFMRNPNLTDI